MSLGPPELRVVLAPLSAGGLPSLAGGLLLVMPSAERSEVGLSMVIARHDVVHVGRGLRAAITGLAPVSAAVAIASQDALADSVPVWGQALPPIGGSPLRHARITANRRGRGGPDCVCEERKTRADPGQIAVSSNVLL